MAFSINQVRNVYVATKVVSTAISDSDAIGTLRPVLDTDSGTCYAQYKGADEQVYSTDKFDLKNILYMTNKPISDMNEKLNVYTVTVATAVAGQTYELRLNFRNYIGLGEEDTATRVAVAYATSADTAAIAASLVEAVKGVVEPENLATVTYTAGESSFTIKEVVPEWKKGRVPVAIVRLDTPVFGNINNTGVYTNEWGTIAASTETAENTGLHKVQDLVYFGLGSRGDEYRNMGWPYVIDSDDLASLVTADMNVLTVHYAYVGDNESVQKSEKDIQVVGPTADITTMYTSISNAINGTTTA